MSNYIRCWLYIPRVTRLLIPSPLQQVSSLRNLSDALKAEKRRMERELIDLKTSIDFSDDMKNKEILRLRDELEQCEERCQQKEGVCR